jgi:hypothetical protein
MTRKRVLHRLGVGVVTRVIAESPTLTQAAHRLGVTAKSVHLWRKAGLITATPGTAISADEAKAARLKAKARKIHHGWVIKRGRLEMKAGFDPRLVLAPGVAEGWAEDRQRFLAGLPGCSCADCARASARAGRLRGTGT